MTQPSETEGYSAYDHIKALEEHSYVGMVECCIVNNSSIPDRILKKYLNDGAEQVRIDRDKILNAGIKLIEGNYASLKNDLVRHDPQKLARAVIEYAAENVLARDSKRAVDYYYVRHMLENSPDEANQQNSR